MELIEKRKVSPQKLKNQWEIRKMKEKLTNRMEIRDPTYKQLVIPKEKHNLTRNQNQTLTIKDNKANL